MGKARQFAQNSFWLMVSTVSVMAIGAVYRLIIGRVLGPTEFGRYTFILTFIAYFLVIALFGIRSVIAREISRNPSAGRSYTIAAYKIRAVTTLLALISCCVVGYMLHREQQVTLGIYVLSLSIATVALGEMLEGVLIAFQRSYFVAAANLVGNLLKLGFGIYVLKLGYGLIGVLWVFVITSAVTTGMNWAFVEIVLHSKKQRGAKPGLVRYVFKESIPFFVLAIAGRVYAKNDILFLALIKGDRVTGLYGAAYVFVDLLILASNSITTAAYPMIARLYGVEKPGKVSLAEAYERLHKHMLMFFLPVSVLLAVFGRELLLLLFGRDYIAGYPALRVLIWVPVVEISCLVSGNFLSATYRQGLEARIAAVMAALNIAWTVSFIVLFGAIGAAVATLGASGVNAIVRYIYIEKNIGKINAADAWIKPIACAAVMLAATLMISQTFWVWRLLTPLLAYVLAIALIRPYDAEDRRLVRSVLGR